MLSSAAVGALGGGRISGSWNLEGSVEVRIHCVAVFDCWEVFCAAGRMVLAVLKYGGRVAGVYLASAPT